MSALASTPPRRVGPHAPGPRGWAVPGGGRTGWVQSPPGFRGTTVQVCGLWPWATGAGTPMVGVPLGRHLFTGASVCMDPISWFRRGGLISNPSTFVMSQPGLGKSSMVRRQLLGLAGYGVIPMVLGDLRPDYVDLIRAIGGQVIRLAPGRSVLNVLDPGESSSAATRLTGTARTELLADAERRRVTMLTALITISRSTSPTDNERSILRRALRLLDARLGPQGQVPVLADVHKIIEEAPEDLRQLTVDRGDLTRYQDATRGLQMSLMAILGDVLGDMFGGQTTTPVRMDRPVVFDVSAIGDNDAELQGAALMACWSAGFATANVSHALADAGLAPRRYYFAVLDELHRALRAGAGMVDRVDLLTRLNRRDGVGVAMITHTMQDLSALPAKEDVAKARGFIERSGIVVTGGLPRREIRGDGASGGLSSVLHFTQAEEDLVAGWSTPPTWTSSSRQGAAAPPGRGKFLIKVGERPGIPVQTQLTRRELEVGDTNRIWHDETVPPEVDQQLEEALSEDEQEWT